MLPRRHLCTVQHIHIGKESDRVQLVALEDTDGTLVESEAQQYSTAGLSDTLRRYAMRDLVRETGVPRQTLYDLINGASPTHTLCEKIQGGLARLTRPDGRDRAGAGAGAERQKGRTIMEEYGSGSYDAYETYDAYESYPIGAAHTPNAGPGHDADAAATVPTRETAGVGVAPARPDRGASVNGGPGARDNPWTDARLDQLRHALQVVRRGQTMVVIADESGVTRDTLYKFLRGARLYPAHADTLLAALKRLRITAP